MTVWFQVTKHIQSNNQDNNEVAIIRSYGEYLYAVPFTRITRKSNDDKTPALFERKLYILKISDVKMPLTFEQVGPLQPVEVKTAQAKQ